MSRRVTVRSHTGPDGSLSVRVPTGLPDAEVEAVITVEPVGGGPDVWPEGFLERMFGALADSGLERQPQGEYESRDPLT